MSSRGSTFSYVRVAAHGVALKRHWSLLSPTRSPTPGIFSHRRLDVTRRPRPPVPRVIVHRIRRERFPRSNTLALPPRFRVPESHLRLVRREHGLFEVLPPVDAQPRASNLHERVRALEHRHL